MATWVLKFKNPRNPSAPYVTVRAGDTPVTRSTRAGIKLFLETRRDLLGNSRRRYPIVKIVRLAC